MTMMTLVTLFVTVLVFIYATSRHVECRGRVSSYGNSAACGYLADQFALLDLLLLRARPM